jgi:hypothetical protein
VIERARKERRKRRDAGEEIVERGCVDVPTMGGCE